MDGLQDRSGVGVEASGRSRGGRSRAGRRNYVSDGRPASRALALRARLIYDAHHMSAATAGRTAPSRKEVTHERDRKSTRLNSSHLVISYAVFCLKKKKRHNT